jgi:hypothetical protein
MTSSRQESEFVKERRPDYFKLSYQYEESVYLSLTNKEILPMSRGERSHTDGLNSQSEEGSI